MKKIVSVLTAAILCFAFMLPITVSAASANASLTGPGTVRAGDTITLSFNIKGSGIFGASGTLSYDSNHVTLMDTSQKIGSPWAVEFNGNNFVAYDNNLSNPINGNKTLFTVKFKVKSVAEGTNINIAYNSVTASDGSADANVGTVVYSTKIAAPLSAKNKLSQMTVSNATISPSFSPDQTNYTTNVNFDVSKLQISAVAEDSKAKVSVYSPTLKADGKTNVTVTVTAENGSKMVYTILVHRAKDPNYVPSSNNSLDNITVEGFLLSPVFTPENTRYVVWLPFETEKITVTGTANDVKASVETIGENKLLAGQDNEIKVICTAENGEKKEYIIVAKRAAGHDGSVDEKVETDDAESGNVDVTDETPKNTVPIALIVILSVICGFAMGYLSNVLIRKFKK